MKHFFVLTAILFSQIAFSGPHVVGNGGDIYAIEFLGIAQQLSQSLAQRKDLGFDPKKIESVLHSVTIESTVKSLVLNGVTKDALNFPTKKYIVFNRISWAAQNDLTKKGILVLHELMGLAEIDDKTYKLSTAAIDLIQFGQISYDGKVFDQTLTQEQVKKFLPLYLKFIEERAAEVLSPIDNESLQRLTIAANKPDHMFVKDGKHVGNQGYSASSILEWVKSAVDELLAITKDERVQSNLKIVNGFRTASHPIQCELGYLRLSKMPTDRVVRCVDSRSSSSSEDEEGFVDERTILLSIDAKTLEPLGVLSIDTLVAG